jgi:prepilin-type N-terminal cleavage/methylation domain-containing protein
MMFIVKGNARGMTLVELAIVVALLGILMAMAGPSLTRHLPTIRFRGDVRDVASSFRLARMRAVAEGVQYGIFIDADESPAQYVFFEDDNLDETYQSGSDGVVFTQELFKKSQIRHVNFANDVAIFKPDGSSNGGWLSMGLPERSDTVMVDVLPSTGRVKIIR